MSSASRDPVRRSARRATRASPWLYGRTPDILFGYGLAYVVSVPLLLAAALQHGESAYPLWISTLLALAISTPHYGATLLRVYENPKERRAYRVFAVWVSLVLFGLFVAGLHSAAVGSILLTVYVIWGIWHFSAQNYGIASMYLRRCGVKLNRRVKAPLYTSFVLSAALAILSIYVVDSHLHFAAGSQDASGTFRVLQLGIPQPLRSVVHAAGIAGYALALILLAVRLRRRLPLRQLGPVGVLMATQALWFSVPAVGTIAGVWNSDTTGYAFAAIWISTAHALQYLWLTTYYAQRAGRCPHRPAYLVKCLFAGAAVTVPALLLAPGMLGGVTIGGSAIVVLVFSVVNLHHFVLDGAIWKLTDGRIARLLVRSESHTPVAPGGWRWARATVFTVGALVVAQQLYGAWAVRLVFEDTTPLERRHLAAERLYVLGLDTPDVWLLVARRAEAEGDLGMATSSYRWGLSQYAQIPPLWAVERLAWLLVQEQPEGEDSLEEALRLAGHLVERLGDGRPDGYRVLAAAHAAAGNWKEAIRAAEWALTTAEIHGDGATIPELSANALSYRNDAFAELRP